MQDLRQEAMILLSKWWVWITYVLLGIVAKFSYDLVRRKKISLWVAIGSTGIAGFTGFLASMWSMAHAPTYGAFIVPISTLLSDKIFMYLFALDYTKLFDILLNKKS